MQCAIDYRQIKRYNIDIRSKRKGAYILMSDFFTDSFTVSKLAICCSVKLKNAALVHRNRPYHGLVIKHSGIVRYEFTDGKAMTVYPGQICYLPKYSDYNVTIIEDGECSAINFDLAESELTYPAFVRDCKDYNKLSVLFKTAVKTWTIRGFAYHNQCMLLLYSIILALQTESKAQYIGSRAKRLVESAEDFIKCNLSDTKLSVASVADRLGISPEYLRRIFKCECKSSPKQYILELRIERAKELLNIGEMKVCAVGEVCGFESPSHFSAEFKKATSFTPTEYMRS